MRVQSSQWIRGYDQVIAETERRCRLLWPECLSLPSTVGQCEDGPMTQGLNPTQLCYFLAVKLQTMQPLGSCLIIRWSDTCHNAVLSPVASSHGSYGTKRRVYGKRQEPQRKLLLSVPVKTPQLALPRPKKTFQRVPWTLRGN